MVLWVTKYGMQSDGVLTLPLGMVGAAVLLRAKGPVGRWALVLIAGLVTLIGIIDLNSLAAIGLYMTLFGGIAWLVDAFGS